MAKAALAWCFLCLLVGSGVVRGDEITKPLAAKLKVTIEGGATREIDNGQMSMRLNCVFYPQGDSVDDLANYFTYELFDERGEQINAVIFTTPDRVDGRIEAKPFMVQRFVSLHSSDIQPGHAYWLYAGVRNRAQLVKFRTVEPLTP
jgi:hypothetical protein